ncbi:sentrin-specific protease-like isoform X1 [Bombyx mandarina]|uniref:Sentrin-specific protease-like isoform X1 n=1 Tax=Bombyx mandarina TaxID=7092 RepID=A0A6J2K1D5_BOMMA|nr:sentrin-specific protease-like isoform X1 [Bombyx mandarina]
MKSVLTYIRGLLGWVDENPTLRTSFKRDRADDEYSSDEELPALKRVKQLKRTNFPDIMTSKDSVSWEKNGKNSKTVCYVPIQLEAGHPSTSTPIEPVNQGSRIRNVPIKYIPVLENGSGTPTRKPRIHTPVRPVINCADDDDDDDEVTLVEANPERVTKKAPRVYILDDDDEDNQNEGDDVIFVKKISRPPSVKPCIIRNQDVPDSTAIDPVFYRLKKTDRSSLSPKTFNKYKNLTGISKPYKKVTQIPKWMHTGKSTNLSYSKNRLLGLNGARTTLSEVFNLDEKRNYQELIRKVSENVQPRKTSKPIDIVNLAEESEAFRLTKRTQKNSLNEIKFVEKGLAAEKESDATKEYDPITVASINSSDSEIEVVPSESSTSSSYKIEPINTLLDSFKEKAVIADDWLSKINLKYKNRDLNTKEKLREAHRESEIITKVIREQKFAHLENKLKYELSIPESLFEEPQPVVELPTLTAQQEQMVNKALGPGPAGQILVEKFNLRISRRDLQTLSGLNWLNDEVINFYMNLLMQRSQDNKDLPKVYAANTFFYPKLMQSGQAGLRRWTRKVDIFSNDLMIVPVHLGVHWCLSIVDFGAKKVSYLDSMGGRNQACLDALLQYLRDEHKDKKGQPFDDSGWKTECLSKDIPQQMNGSDCGMFACTFAEFRARNAPYCFSQADMSRLRRKAALEILTGTLLL